VLLVAGVIALPSLLDDGGGDPSDVGLAGTVPAGLGEAIERQGTAIGAPIRVHAYTGVGAGEDAVRQGEVELLVVDGQVLEWRRQADDRLRAVALSAIQALNVRDRAQAAGISGETMASVLAPVAVEERTLGSVAGRSPDDELAAMAVTVLLFITISTYGNLVLTGVVEEKASRVVEVLLARMPARNLLVGKVAGIGLLGLAQVAVTALTALAATAAVSSVDLPAIRGTVLVWAVAWFVLGYALYAMAYGALGSLTDRAEDAQGLAAPLVIVLIAGYFASFVAVGRPDSGPARAVSLIPMTAPLAMPSRIAMSNVPWWELVLSVVLTLAAIAGLVGLGGRIYTNAILHTGPRLPLRRAWRSPATPIPAPGSAG
jgi:ABC-2 type transport system permease protein